MPEELCKFLYGVAASLGFAAFENLIDVASGGMATVTTRANEGSGPSALSRKPKASAGGWTLLIAGALIAIVGASLFGPGIKGLNRTP